MDMIIHNSKVEMKRGNDDETIRSERSFVMTKRKSNIHSGEPMFNQPYTRKAPLL